MILLFSCNLIFAQHEGKTSRNLNIGISVGSGTNFHAKAIELGGRKAVGTPIFSEALNYFSINAQLGRMTNPNFGISLETGYQTLRIAHGPESSNTLNGYRYKGYEAAFVFLKPGLFYRFPLSERLSLVPKIHVSGNLNINGKHSVDVYGLQYSSKFFFVTIDPSVELRANIAKAWSVGFFAEYQQGLYTAVETYIVDANNEKTQFSTYNGSGITLGLRLSYCIPCKE